MKLIALIGLVSIEKIELAIALATHYTWESDESVMLIDNVARLAIDRARLSDEPLIRVKDDLSEKLVDVLQDVHTDVVIMAVSEAAELDKLFFNLEGLLVQMPDIDLRTLGLIDLRTCDCFPHLREKLENYSDVHFLAPFDVNAVIEAVE